LPGDLGLPALVKALHFVGLSYSQLFQP